MKPRERVLTALRHQEPDRVPLDLGGLTTTIETDPYNELKTYLGIESETKTFVRDHVAPSEELLERFRNDTRHVLPFGTPDDVEREARRRIFDLGPGGGYVLTAVHNIQKGLSPRNICRMYEDARKHGRYPIKGSRSPGPR